VENGAGSVAAVDNEVFDAAVAAGTNFPLEGEFEIGEYLVGEEIGATRAAIAFDGFDAIVGDGPGGRGN
jgi:hypothetical protein